MIKRLAVLGVVLAAFLGLSLHATSENGVVGYFFFAFYNSASFLLAFQVVCLLVLGALWIRADARSRGWASWPFLLLTVVMGLAGPLVYLMFREIKTARR